MRSRQGPKNMLDNLKEIHWDRTPHGTLFIAKSKLNGMQVEAAEAAHGVGLMVIVEEGQNYCQGLNEAGYAVDDTELANILKRAEKVRLGIELSTEERIVGLLERVSGSEQTLVVELLKRVPVGAETLVSLLHITEATLLQTLAMKEIANDIVNAIDRNTRAVWDK